MPTSSLIAPEKSQSDALIESKDVRLEFSPEDSLEISTRTADLDRRESALNARLAAFEVAVRRFESQRNAEVSSDALKASKSKETSLNEREKELDSIAVEYEKQVEELARQSQRFQEQKDASIRALEARRKELQEKTEQLKKQESDLSALVVDLEAREAKLARLAVQSDESIAQTQRLEKREADAARLEARLSEFEKALERKEASLDAREKELERKSAALLTREETMRRLRAENNVATLRLIETKDKLDEKEREFQERSQSALDTIRKQKEILFQLRQDLERQVA